VYDIVIYHIERKINYYYFFLFFITDNIIRTPVCSRIRFPVMEAMAENPISDVACIEP
jgi:hypothetical protein